MKVVFMYLIGNLFAISCLPASIYLYMAGNKTFAVAVFIVGAISGVTYSTKKKE